METSLIDSSVTFNSSLDNIDDEESTESDTDSEVKTGSVYRQKKRFNGIARRKIEDYLEMKKLEQQNRDIFYDDLFLDKD
jgi:hypothetical protein